MFDRIFKMAWFVFLLNLTFGIGCTGFKANIPIETGSVNPGTAVTRGEARFHLLGTPIFQGGTMPSVSLVDALTMKDVDPSKERGAVLLLSIVPSIDTAVCEEQTHYLGEEGEKLPKEIRRITISRDTPFAQKRFAKEAKLTQLQFLSDYKQGEFGRATGLLIEKTMLLARSLVLVDKKGIIRYIQVVPEITRLPDMEKAFQKAMELNKE